MWSKMSRGNTYTIFLNNLVKVMEKCSSKKIHFIINRNTKMNRSSLTLTPSMAPQYINIVKFKLFKFTNAFTTFLMNPQSTLQAQWPTWLCHTVFMSAKWKTLFQASYLHSELKYALWVAFTHFISLFWNVCQAPMPPQALHQGTPGWNGEVHTLNKQWPGDGK